MRHALSLLAIFTLLTTLHAQVPSYVPTNGLVGWWPFNGNANDESGNGNNGTVNGPALISDRDGVPSAALSFDGINDLVTIPHSSSLTFGGQQITISFWVLLPVYQNNGKANNCIYKASYPGLQPFGLRCWFYNIGGSSSIGMYIANGSYNTARSVGGNYQQDIGLNVWKNVVYTNDNIILNYYVDGVLVASTNNAGTTIGQSTDPLYFGGPNQPNQNTDGYFAGHLDDIGIWNRALTPAEIQGLYNAGQPPTPCISPDPVSFTGLSTSYTTSDGPVTLTGTPSGGVFIGPGVTGSTFSPAVAGEGSHSISYTYLDGDNCVNTFSLCTSVALGMGVEPGPDALGGVRIFPNPNRGQFTVELELSGLVSMQVFDARGALVHNEVFTASGARTQRNLDLSNVARGSYTLFVENNGGRVSQRVVVE